MGRAERQILKPAGLSVLEATLDSHKVGDRWTCVQPLGPLLARYPVARAASRAPEGTSGSSSSSESLSGCQLHLHPPGALGGTVAYKHREACLGPAYLRAPSRDLPV